MTWKKTDRDRVVSRGEKERQKREVEGLRKKNGGEKWSENKKRKNVSLREGDRKEEETKKDKWKGNDKEWRELLEGVEVRNV